MPNWCCNHATIRHDDKQMIDIIEKASNDTPEEIFNTIRPNPTGEWQYDWSIENWGTKWDASGCTSQREDDNTIHLGFDTAWGPPCELYAYMVEEQGYDVDAYYWEEGMGFAGRFSDGMDDYYEYTNLSADEIADQLGYVDEFWGISERMREYEQEQKQEEWDDFYDSLEKSDWYPASNTPTQKGVYEVKTVSWPYAQRQYWDGDMWCFYDEELDAGGDKFPNEVSEWRGVTQKAYEEAELASLVKELDNIEVA